MIEELPDDRSELIEVTWNSYRQAAVRAAVERLPANQRQALSLAFFDELTHDQVAETLNLPLGTVKTRIRSALQKLRRVLAPIGVVTALAIVLFGVIMRAVYLGNSVSRVHEALALVSASNSVELHLSPTVNAPATTHGWYRYRSRESIAVMALHLFPVAPPGKVYQAWAFRQGVWTSLGFPTIDLDGNAVVVVSSAEVLAPPEVLEVTIEPIGGSQRPAGLVMIRWPAK